MWLNFNDLVHMIPASEGVEMTVEEEGAENACEVEIIQGGGKLWGGGAQCVLKVLNGIVVRSEKQELRVFIIETDRTSREERQNPSDGENSVKGRLIKMCAVK